MLRRKVYFLVFNLHLCSVDRILPRKSTPAPLARCYWQLTRVDFPSTDRPNYPNDGIGRNFFSTRPCNSHISGEVKSMTLISTSSPACTKPTSRVFHHRFDLQFDCQLNDDRKGLSGVTTPPTADGELLNDARHRRG